MIISKTAHYKWTEPENPDQFLSTDIYNANGKHARVMVVRDWQTAACYHLFVIEFPSVEAMVIGMRNLYPHFF